jgi:hypothetical protein
MTLSLRKVSDERGFPKGWKYSSGPPFREIDEKGRCNLITTDILASIQQRA